MNVILLFFRGSYCEFLFRGLKEDILEIYREENFIRYIVDVNWL